MHLVLMFKKLTFPHNFHVSFTIREKIIIIDCTGKYIILIYYIGILSLLSHTDKCNTSSEKLIKVYCNDDITSHIFIEYA